MRNETHERRMARAYLDDTCIEVKLGEYTIVGDTVPIEDSDWCIKVVAKLHDGYFRVRPVPK